MKERVFIDTNVLIYVEDSSFTEKQHLATSVVRELIVDRRAVISTQILQEFYFVATKKLRISKEHAQKKLQTLSKLDVVLLDSLLILRAIDLHRLHNISFWDALVVRAAAAGGCRTVLSEDLGHGQIFDGVKVENPFRPNLR